ncbi:hypothetical protein LCGC14_2103250, partial [marine sediment metagenome]
KFTVTAASGDTLIAGNLTVSGTGPHAIGGAVDVQVGLFVQGAVGSGFIYGTRFAQDFTGVVDTSAAGLYISPTITEAASGAHPLICTLLLSEPAIVGAGATTTIASTLYIADAPTEGATNTALYVASGAVNFQDTLLVVDNVGIGAAVSASTFVASGAATTAKASLRAPHGSAPTSPVNGDMWTTTAGLYVRINGGTVGPLS